MNELEECNFWIKFTGLTRERAVGKSKILYWILIGVIKNLVIVLRYRWLWYETEVSSCKSIAIFFTKNQAKAIEGWYKRNGKEYKTASNKFESDVNIPWGRFAWYCLLHTRETIKEIEKLRNKENYYPWIEEFIRYKAGKKIIKELFERVKFKNVVIANDHNGIFRAIIRFSKENNINLIYTQHATIGSGFPALTYNLSMLDGVQAVEQYCVPENNNEGIIIVTGRESGFDKMEKQAGNKIIGIATNNDDKLCDIIKIIIQLKKDNKKIILRPHPGDIKKPLWKLVARLTKVNFHDKNLDDFMSCISVLVTGLSGIVLDANLRNIQAVIIGNNKLNKLIQEDYYKYIKYKLAIICNDSKLISEELRLVTSGKRVSNVGALMYDSGFIVKPDKWSIFKQFIDAEASPKDFHLFGEKLLSVNYGENIILMQREYHDAVRVYF